MGQKIGSWLLWGAIAYMVLFVGFCGGPSLGQRGAIAAYDLRTLGDPGAPVHGALAANRAQLRKEINELVETLKGLPLNSPKRDEIMRKIQALVELEEKLGADVLGIRLPTGTSWTAVGYSSGWTMVRNKKGEGVELYRGDIVCSNGSVANTAYIGRNGHPIEVTPDGTPDKIIDYHTAHYEQFPMLSFLGRVNGDDRTIFVIHAGCHPSPITGKRLQIGTNTPYKMNGWEAAGLTVNRGRGAFSIEMIAGAPTPNGE